MCVGLLFGSTPASFGVQFQELRYETKKGSRPYATHPKPWAFLVSIILPAMLHILAGNAADDIGLVLDAAKSDEAVEWIVPKKGPNDRTLFHLPSLGFTARGVIASEPEQDTPGRYGANVSTIRSLSSAVPLAFVRKNHPAWKWPTYPSVTPHTSHRRQSSRQIFLVRLSAILLLSTFSCQSLLHSPPLAGL